MLEATNGLQSFTFFIIVLFSHSIFSLVSMSHSVSSINAAYFFISQLQLITLKKELPDHFSFFKHSHLHFSLFHFCLLL